MNRCLPVVILLVVAAAAAPSRVLAQEDRLKIGFYNVLNLFDVWDDPYTDDEGTAVKPRDQIELVAQAIRQLDADVLGLCEVENEHVLHALQSEFLSGMGYEFVAAPLTNDRRGIKLGLLSRYPIESITSYRWQDLNREGNDRQWRFARDLMHARVAVTKTQTLDVLVVHLKSKRDSVGDPKSVAWRTAEAAGVRRIVDRLLAENPGRFLTLIGDFNSNPDEPATGTLLAPDESGKPVLIDLHAQIPKAQRITRPSTMYPDEIIDFVLANEALAGLYESSSAQILPASTTTRGSDHLPVAATFKLTTQKYSSNP